MREKVNTAYSINDPRKFDSIEDGEKELNRLRAVCIRWKKKQGGDIDITLGLSVTNGKYASRVVRDGNGRKQIVCDKKVWGVDETGTLTKVAPDIAVAPHLHILVDGYGASSCADYIIGSMRKYSPTCKYSKQHLKTAEQVKKTITYIEKQSTILRHV